MSLATQKLSLFSPRALNLFASIFAGADVRVVLSSRASHPATVVLENWTLVLDPEQTGLFDLALCARLLEHRPLRKEGPEDAERRDRWLTRRARKLAVRSRRQLRREYPGITRLAGVFRDTDAFDGLHMACRQVRWEPLADRFRGPRETLGDPDFIQIPELEITGAEEDFAWLLEALADGRLPVQTLPDLEDLPYRTVPFRLALGEGGDPRAELFEEMLASPEMKELVNGLVNCYRRKSEVRQERLPLGKHTLSGVRLDTNRLVDTVVGRRVGLEPRLFRRKASLIEPVFDPREHLVVVAFDLNDVRSRADWWEEEDARTGVHRFLAGILTAYQQLEVDCEVQAFADHLVTLPDGQVVCLHLCTTLKRSQDPFDQAFFHRLAHLLNAPPGFPGEPACFHPLAIRDMTAVLERVAREESHSYRSILWWARRAMPRSHPAFRSSDFLMRSADSVDSEVEATRRRYDGTLDLMGSFVPQELKSHGRPGRFLSEIPH